jgi:antitoxin component of RelBE/YafQ-DinJ toxin-antitoxin module
LKFRPIKINFTEEEYQTVKTYAEQCGITMSELCRMLLNRYHPKPIPTEAYRTSLEQLYRLHKKIKEGSAAALHLSDIILLFQEMARLPERSEPIGDNKFMAYQREG